MVKTKFKFFFSSGLRHIVDNLAKKYCVVKDDHVHDSMDGF
jgi:hypothetical protein